MTAGARLESLAGMTRYWAMMSGIKATNTNGQMLYGAKAAVSMIPLTADKTRPTAMRVVVFVLAEALGWERVWLDMRFSEKL